MAEAGSRLQRALVIGQPMVSTLADIKASRRHEDGCDLAFQHAAHWQNGDWSAARFQNLPRLQTRFQRPHRDGDQAAACGSLAVAGQRFQRVQSALQIPRRKKMFLRVLPAHGKTNRDALANPRTDFSRRTVSLRRGHPTLARPTTGWHPANGWPSPGPGSGSGFTKKGRGARGARGDTLARLAADA